MVLLPAKKYTTWHEHIKNQSKPGFPHVKQGVILGFALKIKGLSAKLRAKPAGGHTG